MSDKENAKQKIEELLESQQLGVVATDNSGSPHTSLVAFAVMPGLGEMVFATPRATRKFRNLSENPAAALLVDDRSNQDSDFQRAAAVTAYGKAREINGERKPDYLEHYLKKHPYMSGFATAASTALICIKVEKYSMVTRFQDVVELELPG
jgi:nitroimidazol reductase NimA-like FMN-containing flavoprotein (pyridoxamine 5'-phosphate oxidase superfamily)